MKKEKKPERNTSCSFSSKPQNGFIDLSPDFLSRNSFVFHVQISRSIVAKEEEEIYILKYLIVFLVNTIQKKTKENVSTVQPEKERYIHPCTILSKDK